MQSKAGTVAHYLKEHPADRSAIVEAVRNIVRANMDPAFEARWSARDSPPGRGA